MPGNCRWKKPAPPVLRTRTSIPVPSSRRETGQMLHSVNPDEKRARLLAIIREKSFLTEGGPFKLASGGTSDYYLDMKPTMFSAEGLNLIADVVYDMVRDDRSVAAVG